MDQETNNGTESRALQAAPPFVQSFQKISGIQGGFVGMLDHDDYFGSSMAFIGDLNGDGVVDLAVGAPYDDDGGSNRGAVYVLFMNTDGTVMSSCQKASYFCHTATIPYCHPIMQ